MGCLTCYPLVTAYGPSAVHEANANPAGMFGEAYKHYVGHGLAQLVLVLVLVLMATSAIASELSTHNVVSRYMHNLGADHALPSYLSAVHGRHRSPYLASVTTSALMVVALVIIIAISGDPSALYGQLAGLGSTGVFILMALVSLAVIIWFARKGVPSSENTWKVFIAPALASVALAAVVILTVMHFELVVGGKPGQNLWLLFMLAGTLLAGIAVAAYFRATRPKRYLALGRADRAESDVAGDHGEAAAV